MTDQKQQEPKEKDAARDRFQAEFEALPLDQKFARLFKMEAATISETFNYVMKDPMKVVEKVGDVMTEFGTKIENEVRKATSSAKDCSGEETGPAASKEKSSSTRKPGAPKKPKT
jgi:hypothetical protein